MSDIIALLTGNAQVMLGILALVQSAPGTVFAILMWIELRNQTPHLARIGEGVTVLLDRGNEHHRSASK